MQQSGFNEIPHTADVAIMVWAPTIDGLFIEAARGLYHVMGVIPIPSEQYYRNIFLKAADQEGLLVSFLSEMLYLAERDHIYFVEFKFARDEDSLYVSMQGTGISEAYLEVKAVTYNELEIIYSGNSYQTKIVFDI